jgi:hydroxymethylpyrimidine kinase/phosphomethylpyrimidine kinase
VSLWLVGGVDPTGGAGVDRDRLVAHERAPGLPVTTVVTAMTQQGDGRPARAQATARDQLAASLADIGSASAVKVGLVPASVADVVADALRRTRAPRVVDPVLWASDGGDMGARAEALRRLVKAADLVTPNRAEAEALFGRAPVSNDDAIAAVAGFPGTAWLLKDAESDAHRVCDRLVIGGQIIEICRPRIPGGDPRGTGCALATAIACAMALGASIVDACRTAIAWLDVARQHTTIGSDGRPHLVPRDARR